MVLESEIPLIGSWFRLRFTENDGMAFGISLGGDTGKILLSIFRIIAAAVLVYIIRLLIKRKAHKGLIISLSLILAGALGNIMDSVFYGIFFSSSFHTIAQFMPSGGGYTGFLMGHVVDMFYLPVFEGYLPDWVPFWGGRYLKFFNSIFNIADISVSLGVISILIYHNRFFSGEGFELREVHEKLVPPGEHVIGEI